MGQEVKGTLVGIAADVKGQATVTHPDGSQEVLTKGMPVYLDDTIETAPDGAVNITFNDNTVFAVSDNAKMVIDEFLYDPDKDGEGQADISVVRGAFAYTSGIVGKEDPSDVTIKTPVGSIGIRGTTITGFVPEEGSGEQVKITLIEGAIAVFPNGGGEFYMSEARETMQIDPQTQIGQSLGTLPAEQILESFTVIRSVAPQLFTPVVEGVQEQGQAVPSGEAGATADANGIATDGVQPDAVDTVTQDAAAPAGETPLPTESLVSGTDLATADTAMESQPQETTAQDGKIAPEQNTFEMSLTGDPLLQPVGDAPLLGTAPLNPLLPPPPGGNLLNFGTLSGPLLPPPPPPPTGTVDAGTTTTTGTTAGTTVGETTFYNPVTNHGPVAKVATFVAMEQGALEGHTYTFDVGRFFYDPDGDPITLNITNNILPSYVTGHSISAGILTFSIGAVSANSTLHFMISASDGSLSSPNVDLSFDVFDDVSGGLAITAGNDTNNLISGAYQFSAGAGNDTSNAQISDNNVIFGGIGNDIVDIYTNANRAFGEIGSDTLTLHTGNNNIISGGDGDDTLKTDGSIGTGNLIFGGAGNDLVALDSFGTSRLGGNQLLVDAGSGFDTLKFLNIAGAIDFTAINADKIHSIERVIVDGANNTSLTLNLDDFLTHSDTKTLFIDLGADAGDTLHIDTVSGTPWTHMAGSFADGVGGTGYEGFTNGTATLYVKGGAAEVSGINWA